MTDRLELELAEHLAPVAAPDELWDRIEAARRPARKAPVAMKVPAYWPIAAALLLAAATSAPWMINSHVRQAIDLEALAAEELHDTGTLDFRSDDPAEVDSWVNRNAGVSLTLPSHSAVRIVGARVVRRAGVKIGAVRYEAAGEPAILLVARADGAGNDTAHGHLSWKSGGQAFALASAGPTSAACQLCHL